MSAGRLCKPERYNMLLIKQLIVIDYRIQNKYQYQVLVVRRQIIWTC